MQFVVCRVSRRTELNDSEGFVIDMLVLSEWDETLKLKKKNNIESRKLDTLWDLAVFFLVYRLEIKLMRTTQDHSTLPTVQGQDISSDSFVHLWWAVLEIIYPPQVSFNDYIQATSSYWL